MSQVTAICLCGAASLEITAEAICHVHCHCLDCQRSHGAAYISSVIFPAAAVVVSGQLSTFVLQHTPRLRCAECGFHLFSEILGPGLRSVNAYALPAGYFQPQFHVQCQHAVHPIVDELPHYRGFPAAFGGSDEQVNW